MLTFIAIFLLTATGAFAASAPALVVELWAGFLVIGGLSATFFALYNRGRLPFGHPAAYAAGLVAAALLLIPAATFARIFEAGFDDGPFHGRPFTGDVAALKPSHSVTFRSGELTIYNRADDVPPVLAYLVEGATRWALELDVTENPSYGQTELRSVSGPISISYGIVRDRLDFVAHWTFGAEHGYAYIWKFGDVQRFYLSW